MKKWIGLILWCCSALWIGVGSWGLHLALTNPHPEFVGGTSYMVLCSILLLGGCYFAWEGIRCFKE